MKYMAEGMVLCKGESSTGRAVTAELYPVSMWIESCFYFC